MHKRLLSSIKQVPPDTRQDLVQECTKKALSLNDNLNSFIRIISGDFNKNICLTNSPLCGIPFALKDNFCTKGIHTTCGSEMLKDFIPTYNATVYEKLLQAGAILIGKSNMDEFGMGSGCIDSIYGPTRNCWGYSPTKEFKNCRIAGGSSGGSAVAVASGASFFALGSDTGGSTRNPASYCGVVGLKPTYGLVSRHGLIPLVNSMDVPGIITRSVEDCVTVLNAIAGPDSKDSTTIKLPYEPIMLTQDLQIKNIKIGIPKEYSCPEMSDEVQSVWTDVADMLEKAGAIVKQVSMPNTASSIVVYSILNQCEVSSNMARYDAIEYGFRPTVTLNNNLIESTEQLYAEARSRGFNDVVKNRILAGNYFLLDRNYEKYFLKAMEVRRIISEDFEKVFYGEDSVDILLTPTTLTEAPTIEEFTQKESQDQCSVQDYCTQPANIAGIPAISLPIKLSLNLLPLSVQLMGPHLSEEQLFNVAHWIEEQVNFQNRYNAILNQNIENCSMNM